MFILLPPAAVADAVGKLPDGSSLGEVLGKADVGIVVASGASFLGCLKVI